MVAVIKGNILNLEYGIICHQVNCMGKMGAGIALKIRKKWNSVYQDYMKAYNDHKLVLGAVILSTIVPNQLYVANLCGQLYYGRDKRYTDYDAVRMCLSTLAKANEIAAFPVYIPKNMGCSLAGGDWNVVVSIIEEILPNAVIIDQTNLTKGDYND